MIQGILRGNIIRLATQAVLIFLTVHWPLLVNADLKCSDIFQPFVSLTEPYVNADKIGETPGLHGGKLSYIKKRSGEVWDSRIRVNEDLTPNPDSPISQGDPTFLIRLLGEKAAKFWGFKQPLADVITLPDAQELQGAVQAFNRNILEPELKINLNFYEVLGVVNSRDYLSVFLNNNAIPIGKKGVSSVHDRSVHPIHAFIDPRLDSFAKSRIGAKLRFFELIKKDLPDVYNQEKRNIDYIIHRESNEIDIVSAAMTGLFIEYKSNGGTGITTIMKAELGRIWNGYLGEGKTTQMTIKGLLAWLIQQAPQQSAALNEVFIKFELMEIRTNKMYKEKLVFKKNDLFDVMRRRTQFIIENTPIEQ